MTFNEYSDKAKEFAVYPTIGHGISYPALGLCGEAGEVAEKVKKLFRDNGGMLTNENRAVIIKGLGDVLWYANALAGELGVSLEAVAVANIDKLSSRKERGVLNGSGDNR